MNKCLAHHGWVCLSLLLLWPLAAGAQNAAPSTKLRNRLAREVGTNPVQALEAPTQEITPMLFGIVFRTDPGDVTTNLVPRQEGLVIGTNDLPLLRTKEFEKLLRPYLSNRITQQVMKQLQAEIILYYRRHDRPLVDVMYNLDQDVSNGMLQITVIEGKLNQVLVEFRKGVPNTNRFSKSVLNILNSIRTAPGETVDARTLAADMDWLNRNPFRVVSPLFQSAAAYRQSDLVLKVDERPIPIGGTVGYENTGSESTDFNRLYAGFLWARAFGQEGHLLEYRFTASPDFHALLANQLSYSAPLPWRHTVRLSGTYVNVNGNLDDGITIDGDSYQANLRYDIPLPSVWGIQHEVSVGLDFKHNDNDLLFNTDVTQATPTEVVQVAAGYNALRPDRFGQTALAAQFYYSPGDVTDLNSDEAYELAKPGADATYFYGRVAAERELLALRIIRDNDPTRSERDKFIRLIGRGAAQFGSGNLIPSEEFGLGGYNTVRGYEEREANGSEGFFISTELHTPTLRPARMLGWTVETERLEFLGFFDYGSTRDYDYEPGRDDDPLTLSSAGVGLRYILGRRLGANFALRFDYGFPLRYTGFPAGTHNDPRAHVGVNVNF